MFQAFFSKPKPPVSYYTYIMEKVSSLEPVKRIILHHYYGIKHVLTISIPDVLFYYFEALKYSWDSNSAFSVIFSSIAMLSCVLVALYYALKFSNNFKRLDNLINAIDDALEERLKQQERIKDSITLASNTNEEFNMALVMSNKRREMKKKRPDRPIQVENKVPELLPHIRAERCQKDGLGILNIIDDSENIQTSDVVKVQHTSLKLWPKESAEEFLSPDIENIEILADSDMEN